MTGAAACAGSPAADGGEAREAAAREGEEILARTAPTEKELGATLLAAQSRDTLLQRYLTACGGDAAAALQARRRSARAAHADNSWLAFRLSRRD
jgi:hypothetical protein